MKKTIVCFRLFLLTFFMICCMSAAISAADVTPGAVTNIKTKINGTSATVTWSKAANASTYALYKIDAKSGKIIKKYTKIKKTSYKLTGLKEGTSYTIVVCGISKSNTYGPMTGKVNITIPVKKPATPKNFQISSYNGTKVYFKWSKVSGAAGYTLFSYSETTKEFVPLKTFGKSDNKGSVTGLKTGTNYRFILKSFRTVNGERVYSNPTAEEKYTASEASAQAAVVRGPRYVVEAKTTFTATDKKTGKKVTVKKGTKFTVSSYKVSSTTGYLSDGTTFTVKKSVFKLKSLETDLNSDYSTEVKEAFVNSRGFSSRTNWFIWVSEYKCRINIFKGSRGKWKLMKSYKCVVGQATSRSAGGMRRILKKVANGNYGGPLMYFSPGVRNGGSNVDPKGCAFHGYVDGHTQGSYSHGCVRCGYECRRYMYNNCPVGTAVYVH